MISTRLTKMFDIRHPVVLAPMGAIGRAELVAAVCNAGGLGILGMNRMAPEFIREQIRKTRALTSRLFGVNFVPPCAPPPGVESQLAVCLEERVSLLSLFWCDAAPFVEPCHAAGIVVMLAVGSAEEARRAAASGVDIIVAQGPLLPTVVEAVAPTPVLAAGGIVNGRGLAAALALGAEGVAVGTRFVASAECEAHPDYKKRLVDRRETDTIRGEIFHVGWPPHTPLRALRNEITEGVTPPPGPIARFRLREGDQAVDVPPFSIIPPTIHTEGRTELMCNYAGQGVGLIHDILPAAAIVEQIVAEAEDTIRRLPGLLA